MIYSLFISSLNVYLSTQINAKKVYLSLLIQQIAQGLYIIFAMFLPSKKFVIQLQSHFSLTNEIPPLCSTHNGKLKIK